jgi:cellulose synthase/poly-beta-1,6-N-acetylglucosamine synthase-like glycosyltransferase
MLILLSIVTFLSIVYASLLLYLWWGIVQLKKQKGVGTAQPISSLPSLSVIVPLRNEEESALSTLQALAQQDYAGSWEVWCVDDRSTDKTPDILKQFAKEHPSFFVVHISQNAERVLSPKKRALEIGFSKATGDILLTTDADCTPPPHWLTSMASPFSKDVGIVQGPKEISGPNSLIGLYQKLETLGFVSIEASTFALGRPMLASAPSLAYRRSLFESVGGFSGLEHLVSGDDDMLVHKMMQQKGVQVKYNMDPSGAVRTPAVSSWKALFSQRARWASNGSQYESKSYVLLLSCIFLFYLWLLIGPILTIMQYVPWSFWVVPFVIKYIFDGLFIYSSARIFERTHWCKHLLWMEWINIPVFVFTPIMGYFKWYKWK